MGADPLIDHRIPGIIRGDGRQHDPGFGLRGRRIAVRFNLAIAPVIPVAIGFDAGCKTIRPIRPLDFQPYDVVRSIPRNPPIAPADQSVDSRVIGVIGGVQQQ